MGKTAQKKKRSFWKTALDEFAVKIGKGSQNPSQALPPILEVGAPGTWSVIDARSAPDNENRQGHKGLGKDHVAPVPQDHVEPEKQEKAMEHIETLLGQISQLQDEIEDTLQTEIHLEREIIDLVAACEQSSSQSAKRKRVIEHCKQQVNELPVTDKPVPKSKKRSQRNTQKDDSRHVNNRKVRKKLCLKCKSRKGRNEFHKDRSCKDGLARWCKECKAKAARKYRRKQTAMKK